MERKKIIIIDDSQVMTSFLGSFLEKSGFSVLTSNHPRDGLRIIKEQFPDCVVTDYNMPEINGMELCQELKSDSRLKTIPVIMLTSQGRDEDIVAAIRAGADDYLMKKNSGEVILAKINAMLRLKELRDELVELKQLEAVKSLIVSLGHEFNNILTIILGKMRIQEREKCENKCPIGKVSCCDNLNLMADFKRFADLIQALQKLEAYKTKNYQGDTQMLDLKKSNNS